MDLIHVLTTAASALIASILTYLATRRQSEVNERSVYLTAMENLTADLRSEIERVNADRLTFAERCEALERRLDELEQSERVLKRRVAELEANEKKLMKRIEDLEAERDRLRQERDGLRVRIEEIENEAGPEDLDE